MDKKSVEATVRAWAGRRCPDYDERCLVCETWAGFDAAEAAGPEALAAYGQKLLDYQAEMDADYEAMNNSN